MQPILIQGAMDVEVSMLIKKLDAVLDKSIGSFDFYKGFLCDFPVVISKTKIGMSNASCATTIGILTYSPALVINQGIAGAHSKDLHVNDIVIGKNAVNICSFEKGALPVGIDYKSWLHTNFCEHDASSNACLNADKKILDIFQKATYEHGSLHVGTLGSGDVWNKEIEFINHLNCTLHTLCEDMETVGVYNVAHRFQTPVVGIRAISNNEIIGEIYDTASANNVQEFVLSCLPKLIDENYSYNL